MDSSAVIAVAAVLTPIVGGIVAWLWKHSTRLTGAEIRIEGLQREHADAQRRGETQFSQITATLTRIEDKLDRKVDR
jgi:hypothetical protein